MDALFAYRFNYIDLVGFMTALGVAERFFNTSHVMSIVAAVIVMVPFATVSVFGLRYWNKLKTQLSRHP